MKAQKFSISTDALITARIFGWLALNLLDGKRNKFNYVYIRDNKRMIAKQARVNKNHFYGNGLHKNFFNFIFVDSS